jgi:acetyltransferase-like isoleucine patch superfamily enzyme
MRSESTFSRLKRQALDRLRGQLSRERLVALGLELGERVFIARNAYLDPGWPWLIRIGDDSTIGPHAIILAHDASMQRHIGQTLIAPVVIGKRVFVGAGSIILAGTTIGDNSIVGAGAVVRGDIPPGSLVLGNPAEVVSDVESMVARHREAAAGAPSWPHAGWTLTRGITEQRRRVQREALAQGSAGYLHHLDGSASQDELTA